LASGFLGDGKTFLIDDAGVRYELSNSSGIGKCCYGMAGGDWQGAVLDLPPKESVDVTLTFRRRSNVFEPEVERVPKSLNLTAELTVGDVVRLQNWGPQWQSRGGVGITIARINPR
jgi:hypothetical protein